MISEMEAVVAKTNKQSVRNSTFVDREQFDAELQKYYSGLSAENKKTEWTCEKIQNVIQMLEEHNIAKTLGKRSSDKQYYHARKYDTINIGDEKVLILKRKSHTDPTVRIVPSSEFYQLIYEAHVETGHGRRDKIISALKDKYVVPIWAINIFLKLCKTCIAKKSLPKRGTVVKPTSDDFDRRGHVDLVDFQSSPDNDYKWLLQYQDHLTKFCFLRPLKSKEAKEVAIEILKIILEVGCPNILQSNKREFTAAVLKEIVSLWPSCKILNGRPSKGNIERRQDVKSMIQSWMVDHNSTNWSIGCYFAQFQKNTSFHSTIQRTPFKALFGDDPRLGLNSTNLPKNVITKLETEQDLERFLEGANKENDNLHYLDIRKIVKQEEIAEDDNEIQIPSSNLNLHTATKDNYPEILNIESENAPFPTDNHLDQATVSNHDTLNTEEITESNSNININEREEIPAVNEITSANNRDIISTEIENPSTLCHICNLETSGAIKCQNCKVMIHIMCGMSNENEGSSQLICKLCANEYRISRERQQHLKRAAEEIVLSSKKFKDMGTTVLVEEPRIDRGALEGKNIEKTNELFRVGTPFGTSDWIPNADLSSENTIISDDISQHPSKGRILSENEMMGLIALIEDSKIITDKNTDATTNLLKAKEWQHITHVFNAKYGFGSRTPHQLRLKWDNLKKSSRKRTAEIRMLCHKNGGELPADYPSNDILDRVAAILGNPVDITALRAKIKEEQQSDDEFLETENDTTQNENGTIKIATDTIEIENGITETQNNRTQKFGRNTNNMNSRQNAIAQFYMTKRHLARSKAQNIKLESEKICLEHEKLRLENEKILLEHEKIRLENEKILLEHENLRLQNVKLQLEISKLRGLEDEN
nr:uncharacterized protein LOC110378636 [Helicoverpa armigera]